MSPIGPTTLTVSTPATRAATMAMRAKELDKKKLQKEIKLQIFDKKIDKKGLQNNFKNGKKIIFTKNTKNDLKN
jgi:hypothetical protein